MIEFDFDADTKQTSPTYGSINISDQENYLKYELNFDDPIIIKKKPTEKIIQTQFVSVRYLRPPNLPPTGDLIIEEEPERAATPLTPLVVRRQPPRPNTPEPILIREGMFSIV